MKTILSTILLSVFANNLLAQTSLQASFNSTFSGRNVSLVYSKSIKDKHELGAGIRINLYNLNGHLAHTDDQNNVYKKRLHMTEPLHYFGFAGFYHRNIFRNWNSLKPFLFYDLQVTYSTTRNRILLPYTYDTNGDLLYKEYIEFFGPFTWVEQHIGVGFNANLFNNFYLTQKIGFGSTFILGYDKKLLDKYFDWFAWNFSGLLNVGIGYRFEREKNK